MRTKRFGSRPPVVEPAASARPGKRASDGFDSSPERGMSSAAGRPQLSPEFESLRETSHFALDLKTLSKYRVTLAGLGSTELVERTDLIVDGDPPVQIRLHRPRTSRARSAGVLSIHGGGYVLGDYNMDDAVFEDWCPALGVVGVSVNYRLAPENPFPEPLDDCLVTWQWIHDNADTFGIDPQRVGVSGSSAGGGLAAALAQRVRDECEIGLAFQLLESPMLDDRLFTPSSRLEQLVVWPRQANEFGWRCYLGRYFGKVDMPAYAVPARAQDLAKLPPAFISVGGADGFRDEDIEYALHLSQAGVQTELHVYPGAPHGYQMFVDSPAALQNRRDARDWLARMIGP